LVYLANIRINGQSRVLFFAVKKFGRILRIGKVRRDNLAY
jgi:hypothetical protein